MYIDPSGDVYIDDELCGEAEVDGCEVWIETIVWCFVFPIPWPMEVCEWGIISGFVNLRGTKMVGVYVMCMSIDMSVPIPMLFGVCCAHKLTNS